MRTIAISALTVIIASTPLRAEQGSPIGSAVTVVSYVTAELENAGDTRQLFSGDDVRQQELIEVDNDGRSEIELNDRTKLVLGPGSRMLLDRFVYDPDISGGAIVLNLVKGAFRFVTGIAAKPAYVIRTPNAAITVRGTIFDVYVTRPNETWLLLVEGAVEACTRSGRCLVHDEPGKLIRIADDEIERPQRWAAITRGRDITFDDAFPFIVKPPLIDPEPIFTRAEIMDGGSQYEDGEEREREKKPRLTKREQSDDDEPSRRVKKHRVVETEYTPPVRIKKYRVHRKYVRESHYHPPHRPRGRGILKKGLKAGVAAGVGLGVGYGLYKVFKRRRY